MTDIIVTPNVLPLPLKRKLSDKPASHALPLALNRKLGTLEPVAPIIKRTMLGASITLSQQQAAAVNISNGKVSNRLSSAIAHTARAYRQAGINIGSHYWAASQPFYPLANGYQTRTGDLLLIGNRIWSHWQNYYLLGNATDIKVSDTVSYASILFEPNANVVSLEHALFEPDQPVINLANGIASLEHGVFIGNGHRSRTQAAIPVPCRHYPIPEPPPPPVQGVCRIRPPSSCLPLALTRTRRNKLGGELASSALPLPLMCWHDESPKFIPSLESYIVLNIVTATIGGIVIDPMDFDFKCDVNGYCWQGGIDITDSQYQKIKDKLDVVKGNEPLVIVTTNNQSFAFIAEDITRNRKHAQYSYSIDGRSITARLGADYAHAQGGLNGVDGGVINQDLYASQIVQMQLADTGITLDKWAVNDWLIPAGTYSVTGKTPIAVIADVAKACGGFIYSDPLEPKLSILPRWTKPAWELATATPELVVPTGAMESMSDKKRVNPRYNTVLLIGSHSANVYRTLQGLDRQAPADSNVLYTDRDCVVPQGQAILSDSGTHIDYTIEMRIADKYNIPLAMPSAIWQVADPDPKDKSWNGVVQGVTFTVKRSNDAPVLWQTVTIDRYLDN